MTIDDILKSFENHDGVYKRQEIDAAIALQSEIIPHLINILKDVLADPATYADEENNCFGHIYAFMLLGYFKEAKAHDVIVDIFSQPGDLPSDLFGDCVTGYLPIVLLNTCGGDLTRVKELILNQDAYEYCRTSAIQTITYAVVEDVISREDAFLFFGELLTGDEVPDGSCFNDILACNICDLYPEKLMPVVKKAYEDGIINPGYIGFEEFGDALDRGKERCLRVVADKYNDDQLHDIHDSMSWWANFKNDNKPIELVTSSGRSVKKAKSKKKMTKRSRKANRKKKK